jgi:hypothetical protein
MVEVPNNTLIICSLSPLILKVLGPTAEYLGEGIKSFTEKRLANLRRIFNRAAEKVDARQALKGAVPPRILKYIVDEASYVDNELAAEYFSGLLAASKSDRPRDDRALTFLKLLTSMSNYEIRLHYILYSSFRETFLSLDDFNVTITNQALKYKVFFPAQQFIESFIIEEGENINHILEHAIIGLANRGLIGSYCYGDKNFMKQQINCLDHEGIAASPSVLGSQLYLAVHGFQDISANKLCDSVLELVLWDGIVPVKGAIILDKNLIKS